MAPSHYLKQCWIIVNLTLRNKLQWNFNRNSNIFIQENALEHVVCEMGSILSRPQCVKFNHSLTHPIARRAIGYAKPWVPVTGLVQKKHTYAVHMIDLELPVFYSHPDEFFAWQHMGGTFGRQQRPSEWNHGSKTLVYLCIKTKSFKTHGKSVS